LTLDCSGCLIVEVHDHRASAPPPPTASRSNLALSFGIQLAREPPSQAKAEVYRIVLAPNPATLWTEIGILNRKREEDRVAKAEGPVAGPSSRPWSEDDAVQIEATILVSLLSK